MPIDLTDGSELRLTISRYYTPSGRSIQKPYGQDMDEYYKDGFYNRYQSGEMFSEDKIEINDSLKFETTKGRTVYGGGGILPDFFVPLDTANTTTYLTKLFTTNAIREYSLQYSEGNKKELQKMGLKRFIKKFEVTPQMLQELVTVAENSELEYDDSQFKKSQGLIKIYLKAQIARGIWNNDGFYPIFNETNEIFKEALKLFDEAEQLAQR